MSNPHPKLENLKPFNTRSKEERVRIGRKGGLASGKAIKDRKEIMAILRCALETEQNKAGLTGAELFVKRLLFEAINNGNMKAFEIIFDRLYGKPKEQVDVNQTVQMSQDEQDARLLSLLSPEQIKALMTNGTRKK